MTTNNPTFSHALVTWYEQHRRDLPWRESSDPYRILVSEIMLQQTRVETVIPYFHAFLKRFPTMAALAAAPEESVLKAWEGLGYYQRARRLHAAARDVAASYGGQFPSDPEQVAALPGIGDYTAGAVLSIAFNREVPAVDGNVLRVLARVYLIRDDITRSSVRRRLQDVVVGLIPPGQAREFNQALMELGALVCTPRNPRCNHCPVARWCAAKQAGCQDEVPVRKRASPPRPVQVAAGVVSMNGSVLVVQRPAGGLLGGLWEFPGGELQPGESWEAALRRHVRTRLGMEVHIGPEVIAFRHTFTHLRWYVRAFTCRPDGSPPVDPGADVRWASGEELARLPLSRAHARIAGTLKL